MTNTYILLILLLGQLPFTKVEYQGSAPELTIFGDVISHCQNPDSSQNRQTRVHETVHYINNEIRNKAGGTHNRVNGFYCLKGRGIVLEEPNIKKSQVREFIPQIVRSTRYDLYIENSPDWENQPLYIVDEWVAYTISGMSAVEDHQNGLLKEHTDGVFGCLEFSIYGIALCMTIEKYDPDYWKNNQKFKTFIYWWLRGSQNTFNAGRNLENLFWEGQEKLLNTLRTSPECHDMRRFIQKNFNSVWLTDIVR